MSDFNAVRTRTAKRKTSQCSQCGGVIEIGQKYLRTAQVHEGDFHSFKQHPDCSDAWIALYRLRGLRWGDDQLFLYEEEIEDGEREWLREKFPAVAERLGWTEPKALADATPTTPPVSP